MKRSKHSLSHTKLLSCDMGELIPIGLTEVLPGDTFQHTTSLLARVSPLQTPVMHPVEIKVHHWFVPTRIVWDEWEDFITGGADGFNASVFPTITMNGSSGAAVGSLADYLGVPTGVPSLEVSAIPFRMYNLIYNNFYRDQDLCPELVISKASGNDTTTQITAMNVAWEKDYFTTARTGTQKGPEVSLPLGTTAPVKGIGKYDLQRTDNGQAVYETDDPVAKNFTYASQIGDASASNGRRFFIEQNADGTPKIEVDLAEAASATVNQLRLAMAIQRYEEARSRYGSRFVEYLRYLGVKSSDARLQLPEYLGGGKQMLQFSEVLQTSSDGGEGVGNMFGHGIGAMRSNRYRRFFEEHGFVMTLMSVRPKTIYMQGLARHWNRRTKEDFWQKELEHIGQQEVLNKEIDASSSSPNDPFGYQDRYDEYRRAESSVSGEFRTTLKDWHMAREFSSPPALNANFVTMNPTTRIYQSTETNQIYVYAKHSIQARRLISATGESFIY